MQLRSGNYSRMPDNNESSDKYNDMRYAPAFAGDSDVDAYLMKLEVFKKRNKINDEDIVDYALYALSGQALNFYKINKDSIKTFEQFKDAMQDEYRESVDPQSAHANLTNLKQNADDSVKAFVLKIKEAGQILEKNDTALTKEAIESLMRNAFVHGLRAPLQEKVFDRRCTSFKEAVDFALAIEKNPCLRNNSSPLTTQNFTMQMQAIEKKLEKTVADSLQNLQKQNAQVNRAQSTNDRVICQICDRPGHNAKICFQNPNYLQMHAPKQQSFQPRHHNAHQYNYSRPQFNPRYQSQQNRHPYNRFQGHNQGFNYRNRGFHQNYRQDNRQNYYDRQSSARAVQEIEQVSQYAMQPPVVVYQAPPVHTQPIVHAQPVAQHIAYMHNPLLMHSLLYRQYQNSNNNRMLIPLLVKLNQVLLKVKID